MRITLLLLVSSLLAAPVNVPTSLSTLFSKTPAAAKVLTPAESFHSRLSTSLTSLQTKQSGLTAESVRLQDKLDRVTVHVKLLIGKNSSELKELDRMRIKERIDTKAAIVANNALLAAGNQNIDKISGGLVRAISLVNTQNGGVGSVPLRAIMA